LAIFLASLAGGASAVAISGCSVTTTSTNPTDDAGTGGDSATRTDSGRRDGGGGGDDGGGTSINCKTECANSLCAATPTDPQTGDACDQCLDAKSGACTSEIQGTCRADADCNALLVCANNLGKCFSLDAGAPGADAGADEQCGSRSKGTPNECLNCCINNHQAGTEVFNNAFIACYCK
jgi:hypothetical protein